MPLTRLLKVLALLFALSAYKTLPFAYMARFYYQVGRHLVTKRRRYLKSKENTYGLGKHKLDIFRAVKYSTYASPMEIDMYLHKSNSTYLVDLDIARTKMVVIVFQKLFMRFWGNENGEFRRKSLQNSPFIPVATVECVFTNEILVFQRYDIISSVMAWDNKWLYVLLKFVTPEGKLCSICVTKYVFKKKGRITMRPREFIAEIGLYNEDVEKINEENIKLVDHLGSSEGLKELAEQMKI